MATRELRQDAELEPREHRYEILSGESGDDLHELVWMRQMRNVTGPAIHVMPGVRESGRELLEDDREERRTLVAHRVVVNQADECWFVNSKPGKQGRAPAVHRCRQSAPRRSERR